MEEKYNDEMQPVKLNNEKIFKTLIENKAILPYMFWDNAKSINNSGKTPELIELEEPGYFSSLSIALLKALNNERVEKDLSINEIKQLHRDCSSLTKNLNKENTPGEIEGKGQRYAYSSSQFSFNESFLSSIIEDADLFSEMNLIEDFEYSIAVQPGLKDIITNDRGIKDAIKEKNKDKVNISGIMFANGVTNKETLHQIIDKLICIYHNNIKSTSSDEDKIKAIVQLIRPLQRLHPFPDANVRTMLMLLLNRELIKNNMLPVILDNPNDIDICSTD